MTLLSVMGLSQNDTSSSVTLTWNTNTMENRMCIT